MALVKPRGVGNATPSNVSLASYALSESTTNSDISDEQTHRSDWSDESFNSPKGHFHWVKDLGTCLLVMGASGRHVR